MEKKRNIYITKANWHEYVSSTMHKAMENTKVLYVPCSKDAKTGLVSGVYSSENTCPTSCPFKGNGCYAENFHCHLAWRRAKADISSMPQKARNEGLLDLLRVNIAGDMAIPGTSKLNLLLVNWYIEQFAGKTTLWGYTHCKPTEYNKAVVRYANENGFALSMSCESMVGALKLHEQGIPVVLATDKVKESDSMFHVCKGGKDGVTCRNCRLCTMPQRKKIVVFNLHGARKKAAQKAVEHIE